MEITLQSPLDMHLHVREGDILRNVMAHSAAPFAGAVIMPNLLSPVDSLEKLLDYQTKILDSCDGNVFKPYMTLFFKRYSRQELIDCAPHIIGVKLFPAGITTQSENGVNNFDTIQDTLEIMQELKIPLLVHGETDGFVMDREKEFIAIYQLLAETFPDLHIIMEHITTADAVEFLNRYENISATITLHHLMLTLDDVIGNMMEPHFFCKPIAKTPRDRQALREAVFSGHQRIMFGSDSAPHPTDKKECSGCAAGVYSAPVLLPMLVQLFEQADHLDLLQRFISTNACNRYNITPVEKTVTLTRRPFHIPETYGDIKPYYRGRTIDWSIADIAC